MGIVVLRSTTPWVAVNSRSNSNLLTVISIVPAATAASTGIKCSPQKQWVPKFKLGCPRSRRICETWESLLLFLPYIKCKTYKTSSNRRWCGEVEISPNSPVVTAFHPNSSCEKSLPPTTEPLVNLTPILSFTPPLHNFHIPFTATYEEDCIAERS